MKKQPKQKQHPKQPQKEERDSKPLMCKSYKGFGKFSLAIGVTFLAATLIFGFSSVKIAIASFFIILGAVGLLFYGKYGDPS